MSEPKPVYLLAGRWGKNPDPIIAQIIQGSDIEKPSIAYIGASSGDNLDFFKRMASYFQSAGSGEIALAPTFDFKANIDKTKKILKSADIIFVSGGDVEVGMNILRHKELIDFIKELYLDGKPFFAVSAGSIMLAQEWVRWRNPDDDTTAEIFPCINVASVICDTHGEADNWEELIALLQIEKLGTIGYGIISGNAIKVYPGGKVEALSGPVNRYIKRNSSVEKLSDLLPDK